MKSKRPIQDEPRPCIFRKKANMRFIHYVLHFCKFLPPDVHHKMIKNRCKIRHTHNCLCFSTKILSTDEKNEPMAQKVSKMGFQQGVSEPPSSSLFSKLSLEGPPRPSRTPPRPPKTPAGLILTSFLCFCHHFLVCNSGKKWHGSHNRPENCHEQFGESSVHVFCCCFYLFGRRIHNRTEHARKKRREFCPCK